MSTMDLSIVIPAFNEETKVSADVEAAAAFLVGEGLTGEVIVVDDGSEDGTAMQAERPRMPDGVTRRVLRYETNRGKGFAVRTGIRASAGELVMFADSGLCIEYKTAVLGLDLIRENRCDLAHGSRRLEGSHIGQHQRAHRRVISHLFRWLAPRLIGFPRHITDSQCGFKIYRGDVARELYGECTCDGFMFDAEVILRAARKHYRIKEFPVVWHSDHDSRLRALHVSWRSLHEIIAIKRTLGHW